MWYRNEKRKGVQQLCTRSSATAERQRVSYTRVSRLAHWSCTSLSTASVLQLYNRIAKLVLILSANKPCDIRTLSWIGHSRSFQVILVVPVEIQKVCGRNVQLMPSLFLKLTKIRQWENGIYVDFNDLRRFEDVPARNAFEYLQMIYIARNKSYWPIFLLLIVLVYVYYFFCRYL